MNQDIAVVLSWILALALVLAVVGAVYAVQYARQQRVRVDQLVGERQELENALEHFAVNTVPAVAESVRRAEPPPAIEVTVGEHSKITHMMQWITERHADDLRVARVETKEAVEREAAYQTQLAIKTAEEAVRAEVAGSSRDATSAAVRAFGTSVVSLGADVSQVVSTALREHRNDDVYATLTRIDHTVQQMIRQAQSYVIVCGGLPGRRWPQQSLTDVVGGATGRVRDYLRVRTNELDRVVISRAVEPVVHTLATLLDNALRYSPPTSYVDVSFQEGHHGVTVIIDDAGVRMNSEQMEEARQILANERPVDIHQLGPAPRVGFPGIAGLARRYGFTVYIDGPNVYGGMRAMVYIPESLLTTVPTGNSVAAAAPVGRAEPVSVEANEQLGADENVGAVEKIGAGDKFGASEKYPAAESFAPVEESTVHEITSGGLPKRRRRAVASAPAPTGPRTEPGLARPDIAAAWQSGSQSGRAATEDTEGTS